MDDQNEEIEKIHNKLKKIETLLEKIISKGLFEFVNIEKLDIQGPIMEYKFDKIDIDHVSGALNLGNNLGVRVDGGKENKNVKPSTAKVNENKLSDIGSNKSTSEMKVEKQHSSDERLSKIEEKVDETLREVFHENARGQVNSTHSMDEEVKENIKSELLKEIDVENFSNMKNEGELKEKHTETEKRSEFLKTDTGFRFQLNKEQGLIKIKIL